MTVNIDFAPTFAQLAGATAPAFVDGRSLVQLLGGTPPAIWRKCFLLEHRLGPIGSIISGVDEDLAADEEPYAAIGYTVVRQPPFVGVRTTRWSYARMAGQTALYDIVADPYEHTNVATTKPAQRQRLHVLTTALVGCAGQSCRTIENNEAP
jgi:arylsulfatase A-like enzyme